MATEVYCRLCAAESLSRESPGYAGWDWVLGRVDARSALPKAKQQLLSLKNNSFLLVYGSGGIDPSPSSIREKDDLTLRLSEYQIANIYMSAAACREGYDLSQYAPLQALRDHRQQHTLPSLEDLRVATDFLQEHMLAMKAEIFRTPEAELTPLGVLWEWKAQRLPDTSLVEDWAKHHNVPLWAFDHSWCARILSRVKSLRG